MGCRTDRSGPSSGPTAPRYLEIPARRGGPAYRWLSGGLCRQVEAVYGVQTGAKTDHALVWRYLHRYAQSVSLHRTARLWGPWFWVELRRHSGTAISRIQVLVQGKRCFLSVRVHSPAYWLRGWGTWRIQRSVGSTEPYRTARDRPKSLPKTLWSASRHAFAVLGRLRRRSRRVECH